MERIPCSECAVKNSFAHSFKLDSATEIQNVVQVFERCTPDSIGRDAAEHGSLVRSVGLLNLPDLCGQKDVIENLSIKMQILEVAVVLEKFVVAVELGNVDLREEEAESPALQLKRIAVTNYNFERPSEFSYAF